MPSEIKAKFSSSTALTITLNSLASSTSNLGRQSTFVDNTTDRFQQVLLYIKLKLGTSPTSATRADVYLLRDDNHATNHRTDGAGASDAAITILNAPLIGSLNTKTSGTATGDNLYGEFIIDIPGPKWAIAVVHNTGVNLDSTAANHWARWIGTNPESQ